MTASRRASSLDGLIVEVDPDFPTSVGRKGRFLVLQGGGRQTHENAVQKLREMFPHEHVDDIKAFVRKHLPDAPSLDSLAVRLGASSPTWLRGPSPDDRSTPAVRTVRRGLLWLTGAVAGVVLGFAAVAGYMALTYASTSILDRPVFQSVSSAAGLKCRMEGQATATCVHPSTGKAWRVTAFAGTAQDPNDYRFVSGDQMALLSVFDTEADREDHPAASAYERLYPHLVVRGRVMLGSTDKALLDSLMVAVDRSIGLSTPQVSWSTIIGAR